LHDATKPRWYAKAFKGRRIAGEHAPCLWAAGRTA
jgi:hypothetical protein